MWPNPANFLDGKHQFFLKCVKRRMFLRYKTSSVQLTVKLCRNQIEVSASFFGNGCYKTEEIFNGKLHFLYSGLYLCPYFITTLEYYFTNSSICYRFSMGTSGTYYKCYPCILTVLWLQGDLKNFKILKL